MLFFVRIRELAPWLLFAVPAKTLTPYSTESIAYARQATEGTRTAQPHQLRAHDGPFPARTGGGIEGRLSAIAVAPAPGNGTVREPAAGRMLAELLYAGSASSSCRMSSSVL